MDPPLYLFYSLEPVFMKYGVDLIIEAHEHSYERLWPVYKGNVYQENYSNPKAPVHIVSGAAGCNEAYGVCVNPMLGPRGLYWIQSFAILLTHNVSRALTGIKPVFYQANLFAQTERKLLADI